MMNTHNLKKATNWEVQRWLEENIPELTKYQKEKMRDNEIIRLSPYTFMKDRKKVDNIWWRLSVIGVVPVYIILLIALPLNFIFTGYWGYKTRQMGWLDAWLTNTGLK